MDNQETVNELAEMLEIDKMPEDERAEFMERVGSIVVDAAVSRLLVTLTESEVEQLQKYLDMSTESDDVFAYLLRNYSQFEKIVEEEIAAFQKNTTEVIS